METKRLLLLAGFLAGAVAARAETQTTGTPGSPSATTTISGKQLPPPDPKAWWPPCVVPFRDFTLER